MEYLQPRILERCITAFLILGIEKMTEKESAHPLSLSTNVIKSSDIEPEESENLPEESADVGRANSIVSVCQNLV